LHEHHDYSSINGRGSHGTSARTLLETRGREGHRVCVKRKKEKEKKEKKRRKAPAAWRAL
jgi:hypothetical protein